MASLQSADAAFDPRAPAVATPEPPLPLMRHSFGRLGSWLGQHHLLDPVRGGIPLVRGGVDPTIPHQQAGWMFEHPQMVVQAWRQLGLFGWIALQHGVPADDATLDLIQPDHAAKLRRVSGLALADDRRV